MKIISHEVYTIIERRIREEGERWCQSGFQDEMSWRNGLGMQSEDGRRLVMRPSSTQQAR